MPNWGVVDTLWGFAITRTEVLNVSTRIFHADIIILYAREGGPGLLWVWAARVNINNNNNIITFFTQYEKAPHLGEAFDRFIRPSGAWNNPPRPLLLTWIARRLFQSPRLSFICICRKFYTRYIFNMLKLLVSRTSRSCLRRGGLMKDIDPSRTTLEQQQQQQHRTWWFPFVLLFLGTFRTSGRSRSRSFTIDPNLPVMVYILVQDSNGTDPSQETCPRSCRLFNGSLTGQHELP